ncbi:hypothetical protein HAX54_052811 [Datura stramonium]|uniref:Uncharacterized protein n=1 Tax=Datura stramonium TaxID=4076 RepID=A0ABS8T1C6_DATST|nr:hypothetical protein [Datura stramonium]
MKSTMAPKADKGKGVATSSKGDKRYEVEEEKKDLHLSLEGHMVGQLTDVSKLRIGGRPAIDDEMSIVKKW